MPSPHTIPIGVSLPQAWCLPSSTSSGERQTSHHLVHPEQGREGRPRICTLSRLVNGVHGSTPPFQPRTNMPPLTQLSVQGSQTGEWNVIIETPKGSRNKFKY